MEDLQRQLNALVNDLKQAEDYMTEENMGPFASGDFVVRYFGADA